MRKIVETSWGKKYKSDSGAITITVPSLKHTIVGLVCTAAGTAAMYGIGSLCGDALEHIPAVAEWVPRVVDWASGIDVQGNLDGLLGLLGGLYGLRNSGVKVTKDMKLEEIAVTPIHYDHTKK